MVYLQPNKACLGSHRREKAPRTSDVALHVRHSICHYLQTILTTSKSIHFSVLEYVAENKICLCSLGAQLKFSFGFELPLVSLPCNELTSSPRALHCVSLHLLHRVSGPVKAESRCSPPAINLHQSNRSSLLANDCPNISGALRQFNIIEYFTLQLLSKKNIFLLED